MKILKNIAIILAIAITMAGQCNIVYAANEKGTDGTGSEGGFSGWSSKSEDYWHPANTSTKLNTKSIDNRTKRILGIIRGIGIVVSVIALMVIGIKEITGSIEEKSAIKKAMPVYVLGVIMVVAVTTLPSIIYQVVNKTIK